MTGEIQHVLQQLEYRNSYTHNMYIFLQLHNLTYT